MRQQDFSIGRDAFEFFFGLIGVFNHYSFFTQKLWKKIKGFEEEDEGEVKCAFMSLWAHRTLGIVTYPVGASWCCFNGSQESFDLYLDKWNPLFVAFMDWAHSQR